MYTHIMVPVDLADTEPLAKALSTAADLARHYEARLTLVSISGGLQSKVSNSSTEFSQRLADFAEEISDKHGVKFGSRNYSVPDPSVEVDKMLIRAIEELGVDLTVMASHQPGWLEYVINSHGGRLASHAPTSVFVVRD